MSKSQAFGPITLTVLDAGDRGAVSGLLQSAKAINPALALDPPEMDPFGLYAQEIARARELMSKAADLLDRYRAACGGP